MESSFDHDSEPNKRTAIMIAQNILKSSSCYNITWMLHFAQLKKNLRAFVTQAIMYFSTLYLLYCTVYTYEIIHCFHSFTIIMRDLLDQIRNFSSYLFASTQSHLWCTHTLHPSFSYCIMQFFSFCSRVSRSLSH